MAALEPWIEKLLESPTCDIPDAGRPLGLDRHQSYAAARRGYMPTIQVGPRRYKVPTSWVKRQLQLEAE